VRHILTLNPEAGRALVAFHTAALRNASPLTPAHKELIAAYVSGLNACQYCYGVHSQTAQAFGMGEGVLEALLADVDSADVEERLKPLLRYARKLTLEPTRMTQVDRDRAARCRAHRVPVQFHEPVARRSWGQRQPWRVQHARAGAA
jgi:uncharacterized peroxidase-related enzyme